MKAIISTAFLFTMLLLSCQQQKETAALVPDANNGGITLPENFAAIVVVDTLGRGRHMAVNDNGDIYLHMRSLNADGNGIVALRDTTGDGRADIMEGYSDVPGTGIEIHNGYLYYSDRTHVYRSKMTDGELLPAAERDTIVTLVDGGGHMEKPFTFDNKGGMYVNVGSLSNTCEEQLRSRSPGDDPCVELETRAGIWKFDENELNQQQDLQHRYATGIRNAVALTWNENVNRLYAVQHGRDDLHRYWPEHYTEEDNLELPSEIFFDLEEGDDMGWPYCYYDHLQGGKKLTNPEYGGDGTIADRCDEAKDPLMAFPGHWGPNDVLIYQGDMFPERYKHGAFIAFHGSWNRLGHEQQGYKVVFIPMADGKPSGEWEVFADGFIGPDPITSPGNAFFRPTGLAEGPDGSLYISDSQHGRIWRIVYYPEQVPEPVDNALYQPMALENPEPVPAELMAGKAVYDTHCVQCHMNNGMGAPGMNPPLAEVEQVTGDKKQLIGIILNGLSEPMVIKGQTYNNAMPAFAFLSDKEVADVLTYIRNTFGNEAEAVTPEEVAAERATSMVARPDSK